MTAPYEQKPTPEAITAYGGRGEFFPSDIRISYQGRELPIAAGHCARCKYVFLFPALPEHEPSYCPSCGMKFTHCAPDPLDPENA